MIANVIGVDIVLMFLFAALRLRLSSKASRTLENISYIVLGAMAQNFLITFMIISTGGYSL